MTVALVILAGVIALVLAARFAFDRAARHFHWRVGRLSNVLPGWALPRCRRCGTSSRYARMHATRGAMSNSRTFTMAPLCDPCWSELGSPQARIGYYEAEYTMRIRMGDPEATPEATVAIRAAVAAGL